MARPLEEYFREVFATDIEDYGYPKQDAMRDFLTADQVECDWIITNPPFNCAEAFAQKGLKCSGRGVAMLVRTAFLESKGRYERLFSGTPPQHVLQFTERVPMLKGRLDRYASSATSYCWVVWVKPNSWNDTKLSWIAPCRNRLERDEDYDEQPSREVAL